MADLDALEAAARAATPGPWGTDLFSVCRFGVTISTTVSPVGSGDANADYIAAASPDVVLALIAEVRAARAALEVAYPRALQAAAGQVLRECGEEAIAILDLIADEIDSLAEQAERDHDAAVRAAR